MCPKACKPEVCMHSSCCTAPQACLKVKWVRGQNAPKQQPSMKANMSGSHNPPVLKPESGACLAAGALEGDFCSRDCKLLSVLCSALVLASKRFNRGCNCCLSQTASTDSCQSSSS